MIRFRFAFLVGTSQICVMFILTASCQVVQGFDLGITDVNFDQLIKWGRPDSPLNATLFIFVFN